MQTTVGVLWTIVVSVAAACGGDVQMLDQPEAAQAFAGHSSPTPRAHRWTGTQFCNGSSRGEPVKSSEETEIEAYDKARAKVHLVGIAAGPSKDYSCLELDLDGLVTMSNKSGAFFEGGEPVECASPTGKSLIVELLQGHDTDLRYIEPTEPPTLSFEVAIEEKTSINIAANAKSPARFNCSFDMELR